MMPDRQKVKCDFDAGWIEIKINKEEYRWTTLDQFESKERKEANEELEKLGIIHCDDRNYVIAKCHEEIIKIKRKEEADKKSGFAQPTIKTGQHERSTEVLTLLAIRKRNEATELIVEEIEKDNYIYSIRSDDKNEIWFYKEGIYLPEGQSYILEFCRKVLGDCFTNAIGADVIAKIAADTYIDAKVFFENTYPTQIAVENGILDILTQEMQPFTPEKIFFNKIPVTYDSTKDCPAIKQHFETVLKKKEDSKRMEELFGFLLLKEYKIEKAFIFVGNGRNGKGKTIQLMKKFLGANNCASIQLQDFDKDKFAAENLLNKMANLAGDIDNRALRYTGMFKTLTGRDSISASRKFKSRIDFENFAKLVFAANSIPVTYDISTAFWSRWVMFEFPYHFVTQEIYDAETDEKEKEKMKIMNPDIGETLCTADELSGLLNLALGGLKRLLEQKDFSSSPSEDEVKELWLRKSDSFNAFLMDCVEEEYDSIIAKSTLRQVYSAYCRKYKLKQSIDKAIKEILETQMGAGEDRKMVGDALKTVWVGIKLKPSYRDCIDCKGISFLPMDGSPKESTKTLATHATLAIGEIFDKETGLILLEKNSVTATCGGCYGEFKEIFARDKRGIKYCMDCFNKYKNDLRGS